MHAGNSIDPASGAIRTLLVLASGVAALHAVFVTLLSSGDHIDSAQRVAEFLDAHPRVIYVAYPGLASHPQNSLAAAQFEGPGFGGMMAFGVDGDPATHNRFVANLRVITSAVSLGHDESLIVHVGTDGPRVRHYPEEFRRWGHLRFSVGLEDPDDLVADLDAALAATFA